MEHVAKRAGEDKANTAFGETPSADSRREERVAINGPLRVRYQDADMEVELVDCSPHGMRMVCSRKMQCGERIEIELCIRGRVQCVRYEVRYWLLLWAGAYQIGAELKDELAEVDFEEVHEALIAACG